MTVEFDVLWDQLSSGGQDGRIVAALLHDINQATAFGAVIDSLNAEAPFGRPAYSFRVFNRLDQGQNNYTNMQYGGGKTPLASLRFSAPNGGCLVLYRAPGASVQNPAYPILKAPW